MNRISSLCAAASLAVAAGHSSAQRSFSLEGAVIDSRTGNSLGVVTERGELATLFRAQKAMTFGILRSAGISLEQLSPEVRARIERFQTTNVEAFRAFSQGLDLKDQGRFAEAREQFRRAAELDPNFALAAEQQQSMPEVNLGNNVQTRAVMAAAAGAAVDKGKAAYVVDVARAIAAIQAGQTVISVPLPAETTRGGTNVYDRAPSEGNAAQQVTPNQVVGSAYSFLNASSQTITLASSSEYRADNVRVSGGILETAGTASSGFLAQRVNAASAGTGSLALGDGSTAYWGQWLSAPGSSAVLTLSGDRIQAPVLGRVDYVVGDAPRSMPSSGTAVFTPAGGPSMSGVSGTISVNFVTRDVALQNLAFQIGSQSFSALTGSASYNAGVGSGGFSGNYTGGQCSGCTAFNPQSSVFTGNFLGRDANGLAFTTFLLTGGGGTAGGTHLFTRP
jgi:hypothetical protein